MIHATASAVRGNTRTGKDTTRETCFTSMGFFAAATRAVARDSTVAPGPDSAFTKMRATFWDASTCNIEPAVARWRTCASVIRRWLRAMMSRHCKGSCRVSPIRTGGRGPLSAESSAPNQREPTSPEVSLCAGFRCGPSRQRTPVPVRGAHPRSTRRASPFRPGLAELPLSRDRSA